MNRLKYCIIKDTTKVIDGSKNPIEIMLQNAQNAGFSEAEVEILTEEEYQARLKLEPEPIDLPSQNERIDMLENIILMMMEG